MEFTIEVICVVLSHLSSVWLDLLQKIGVGRLSTKKRLGLDDFPGGASGKEPACQRRRQEMQV